MAAITLTKTTRALMNVHDDVPILNAILSRTSFLFDTEEWSIPPNERDINRRPRAWAKIFGWAKSGAHGPRSTIDYVIFSNSSDDYVNLIVMNDLLMPAKI